MNGDRAFVFYRLEEINSLLLIAIFTHKLQSRHSEDECEIFLHSYRKFRKE